MRVSVPCSSPFLYEKVIKTSIPEEGKREGEEKGRRSLFVEHRRCVRETVWKRAHTDEPHRRGSFRRTGVRRASGRARRGEIDPLLPILGQRQA